MAEPLTQDEAIASLGRYGYGWADSDIAGASAQRGLSEAVVRDISAKKNEPEWMLETRLKALRIFGRKPMPTWGSDLQGIDFDNIKYFVRSTEKQAATWDDLPEDIRNTYDRLGIPEAEKQRLVGGVAAQYECLAGDTLVWTADRGQIPIKEIESGDRVFAYDEAAERFVVAPVKASAQTDTRLTYAVKTTRRGIRATDNHPMLVLRDERREGRQRARYARRWVTVGELQPGDFIAVPRALPDVGVAAELPSVTGLATFATSSVDLMWLLGLYVGDGNLHLSTKTYRVQFAIPATDVELRTELARVVRELFGLRCIEADEYCVVVNSKALTEWIVASGFGGVSLTKRVPDWVYGLPVDQRLAFLGGWVDADGYVGPDKSGSVLLTCANEPLIGQARELVELSGLRAGGPWSFTQPYRHAPERTQIAWRLGISGDFERLGCRNPKRTDRYGRRRYMHSSNSSHGTTIRVHCNDWLGFERVKSIEPYAVEPVYDIEVDGPHNFVAEGLVVHNSEVVYHQIREDLESQGVIFLDTDTGLREHPDVFQEYFGTVIPAGDNKFSALNTAVWSGGCLTADARINVKGKGLVSIADIQPGDEVFGANVGRELERGKVLAKIASGTKPVYEMHVAGRTLEATGNHRFLVARRVQDGKHTRWTAVWAPLEEIEPGEPIAIARGLPDDGGAIFFPEPEPYIKNHSRQQLEFPHRNEVDLLWLFGLWLGDGHTAAPHKHTRQMPSSVPVVSFSVPVADPAHDVAVRIVTEKFGAQVTKVKCGFTVSSKAFGTWLEELGFFGHASTKRLPTWVYSLPHEHQLALLGGLIDADGWTENDGATMSIELANRGLLEDVRQLAIGCGLYADGKLFERTRTVTFRDGHTVTSTHWRLRIHGSLDRVGTRDPVKRGKQASKGRGKRYVAATGLNFSSLTTDTVGFAILASKTPVGSKPTFDIQVVGLENFVANGIVAHNSFIYVPPGVHVDIPLQAYFRINTENMGQFERTLIIADEGAYVHYVEGCLPAGELITTAHGDLRPVESIHVGDHVIGHDGRPHRVTAVQMRDLNGELFSFTSMSPANKFSVTAEHPLLVVPRAEVRVKRNERSGWKAEVDGAKLRRTEPRWIAAKDVAEGDFLIYPKPKPIPHKTVLPLEFARLAGYYLAEGHACLTNGCESLIFSFHSNEFEYVEEVRQACKSLYDKLGSVLIEEHKHSAGVTIYTKAGYAAMRDNVGIGSSTKKLSELLMRQDETFLRELVDAYVSGHGNITRRGGALWKRVHTASRVWAFQLQSILARLGHYATVELRRPGGPGVVQGRDIVREDLYQVQWTEGGHGPKQVRDCGDYFAVPIKKRAVREAHEPVYNLDVEEPDSYLAYGFALHNCTAPVYKSDSLHSAVVEIVVKPHARVRYTTIQNWSNNVYNLVTKRARAEAGATMEWVDGNIGSKVTMKYPAVWMTGEHAKGEVLSVAFAGEGQHQDTGAKMLHLAPNTSSNIVSKSVARGGGRTSYRGLVQVNKGAHGSRSSVKCDALLVDTISRSDTYPYVDIREDDVTMGHEATVSKVGDDQLFYLMSRGLTEDEAMAMVVRGFVEPIAKELPMEYALELNRLIELQMEGSVG
ncbi:Fe-S cluster assembly protein SufB [Mycobacterium sp.]|uniref:Fe-S cluster assembly protein SufB n=1 Tax=Mycobacterium sp. TaxID=1785 RepID=UPI0031E3BA10